MRKPFLILSLLMISLIFSLQARAVEPDEILSDPVLEERARELSKGLRCVVCQNQSIDDSDADLARDLRVIVRERLVAGDSDEEVMTFVTDRYGDYVLLQTPFKPATLLLWISPILLLVFAVLSVAYWYRSNVRQATESDPKGKTPLSDEEKARLDALLKEE